MPLEYEMEPMTETTPTGQLDRPLKRDALALDAGTRGVVAREEAELKAAIALARAYPRDEVSAFAKIKRSCARPAFAENANYAFPRGGKRVEGPSVDLAREMARCWGNIRYGVRIVAEDDRRIHLKGFAFDVEANTLVEMEAHPAKLIQRKTGDGSTQWIAPDERELRELVNRHGAICVRNAILQLMPPDIVEEASRSCKETVAKAARGEVEQDREAAARRIAVAFNQIGVTVPMLERHLGHTVDVVNAEELVTLRQIYKALSDGVAKREEYFDLNAGRKPMGVAATFNRLSGATEHPARVEVSASESGTAVVPPDADAPMPGSPSADTLGDFAEPATTTEPRKGKRC